MGLHYRIIPNTCHAWDLGFYSLILKQFQWNIKEALYDIIMGDVRIKRNFWYENIRFFYWKIHYTSLIWTLLYTSLNYQNFWWNPIFTVYLNILSTLIFSYFCKRLRTVNVWNENVFISNWLLIKKMYLMSYDHSISIFFFMNKIPILIYLHT